MEAPSVVDGLLTPPADKILEVNITATAEAQASTQLKVDKPHPDKPDLNTIKLKERTGGCPLPSGDKIHKKTETGKEERRGAPPYRFLRTIFHLHASSRATKRTCMGTCRRERTSPEVDPGEGRFYLDC
jgi:hypothetical protein